MRYTLITTGFVAMFTTAALGQGMQMPMGHADIAVSNAWARATAGEGTTGAAYLTLTDSGAADQLTGASTPVAGMAHLHETLNANGVMEMRDVGSIALPTGKAVTLAPGGYHLMLMDLRHALKAGDSFPLTLTFAHAAPVTVQVKVTAAGASAPMGHDMSNMPVMSMPGTKP